MKIRFNNKENIMRLSKLFMPTLKEAPNDAIIASNKLMIRAGLARKISNGLYSYLPLGVKVLNKISNISALLFSVNKLFLIFSQPNKE